MTTLTTEYHLAPTGHPLYPRPAGQACWWCLGPHDPDGMPVPPAGWCPVRYVLPADPRPEECS